MILTLDNIKLTIYEKLGSTMIDFQGRQISILNETPSRTIEVLKSNYDEIKLNYTSNLAGRADYIDAEDLNTFCFKILMYYIDLFSRWKVQYKKSNYDIIFYEKDFDNPTTHDIVIHFLKKKCHNWKQICAALINKDLDEFEKYSENRQAYFNK